VGKFFGEKIGNLIIDEQHFADYDVFIPVPLHKNRHRERRYNQAEILARSASQTCNKPVLTDVVKRVKHTKSQTKLSPAERIKNVNGAFAVINSEKISQKNIILVDDVVTTGATTNEIAKMLSYNGAGKICVVCIAHPAPKESKNFGI